MDVKIEPSWKEVLKEEFDKSYFKNLVEFVRLEYQSQKVYPPGKLIFSAFDHTPFDKVKVVLIGQDPYHGAGQAHGLSFSVPEGIAQPPSLKNIFKELNADLGIPIAKSGKMGRPRRFIVKCNFNRSGIASRLSSEKRLGRIYRCSHPEIIRAKRKSGFYFMGCLCAEERKHYRYRKTFYHQISTSISLFCLQRIFWKQTFFSNQCSP